MFISKKVVYLQSKTKTIEQMKQYKNSIDQMISFKPFQDASKKWFIARYVDGEFYETYLKSFKTEKSCQKECDKHFNHWSQQVSNDSYLNG